MGKNITIGILLAFIVYLIVTLIRVENQRYAMVVGFCRDAQTGLTDLKCLAKVETRTNPIWHLFYALTD